MRIVFRMIVLAGLIFSGQRAAGEVGSLIGPGDIWHYQPGTGAPPTNWHSLDFDASQWTSGPSGFSHGFGSYNEATVPTEFAGPVRSLFVRRTFVITNLTEIVWPVLRIDYDDGFVAYLNGSEIARRGLPGEIDEPVPFDASATPRAREFAEKIDLRPRLELFEEGTNVLAVQVQKADVQPNDLTIAVIPELLSGITRGPFLQSTTTNSTFVVVKTAVTSGVRIEFGTSPDLDRNQWSSAITNHHAVELTDLEPDTEYFYRARVVGEGKLFYSEVYSFRTLKTAGGSRFLVLGDTGVGQPAQYQIAELLSARDADLVLHTGDIVYPSFTEGRSDSKLFGVYHDSMRTVPWFFCIGNHDLNAGESHYLNSLHLPVNSQSGGERYYSFDHGDVHFTVLMIPYLSQYKLDTTDSQYLWLTNDLATTTKPWKVLIFHVPMQTSALHRSDDKNLNGLRDSEEIRDVLLPVAEQYGVQVTFSGHDHVFERFVPTNGVQTITTGGGGVGLYGFLERDASTSQFWAAHHFLDVTVEGNRMEIVAVNRDGIEFDSQVVYRAPADDILYDATWNTPLLETTSANDSDGNINNQTFDLIGDPISGLPGEFSALGEMLVNYDKTHLYIGIRSALLRDDSVVYLFVDSPRLTGVSSLSGVGNGQIDPDGQGADGLDFLENLSFNDFTPSIGIVLGDEITDGNNAAWRRPGQSLATGQGAFRLNATLDPVPVRIQQFNRSPQQGVVSYEQNSDHVEISIPYAELGGLQPEDTVRIGAVVAGEGHDTIAQVQRLDTAFIGTALSGSGTNAVVLSGVRVQLGPDLDRDGDGLPNDWELTNQFNPDSAIGIDGADGDTDGDGAGNLHEFQAGTNPRDPASVFRMWLTPMDESRVSIHWKTEPGLSYSLEHALGDTFFFQPLAPEYFPVSATDTEETYTNQTSVGVQVFRVKRVK